VILGFGAAFGIVALIAQPVHSLDVYCYINTGWLQIEYGLNPYLKVPEDIPGWQRDPMLHPVWYVSHAAYGFLFTSITKVLCWLGGGNLWATLMLFKAMNGVAFALTAWVVWRGCKRLQLPHPERALYLLLWNPLLLFHGLANGHNDLLMALMTVVGVYLAIRGRWMWVLPAIMAGVLIKMGSVVVLPFAFLYLVKRHGWMRAMGSAGLAILLGIASIAPFLTAEGSMSDWARLGENATAVHNSLASLVFFPFEVCLKPFPWLRPYEGTVISAIKLIFLTAFTAFYGHLAWRRFRGREYTHSALLRDCLLLQFVLICLASSKYFVWYLSLIFPLAVWLESEDWLHRALVALSCAQILALTFVEQAHGLNVIVMLVLPLYWAWRTGTRTAVRAASGLPSPHFFMVQAASVEKVPSKSD
jgi:alpha-1,6-mannosyltransferase